MRTRHEGWGSDPADQLRRWIRRLALALALGTAVSFSAAQEPAKDQDFMPVNSVPAEPSAAAGPMLPPESVLPAGGPAAPMNIGEPLLLISAQDQDFPPAPKVVDDKSTVPPTDIVPPVAKPRGEELPPPRGSAPFAPGQVRMPMLGHPPVTIIGTTPRPTPQTVQKYKSFVQEFIDPEVTLDLVSGRTRLMVLKKAPRRIQIADETVAAYNVLSPNEITLLGRGVGVTVLTLWFDDAANPGRTVTLTYHVRVVPDPEAKERLERAYTALGDEINHAFPNSNVCLKLVGDKLAVTGNAKDAAEATHILRIVRANAPMPVPYRRNQPPQLPLPDMNRVPVDRVQPGPEPGPGEGPVPPGAENYEVSNQNQIVNLLRIQGEQQVMLRVTVAEVNRAAARSIGMNFTVRNHNGMSVFGQNTGSIATGGLTFNSVFGSFGLGAIGAGNAPGVTGVPGLPGFALGAGGFNNLPAALDNGQIRLAINALRDLNYARSLAEPNLVAINGQTATFQAGGQFPVPIISGYTSYGLQGVNFIPFGVQLSFTPYITDRDRVRLDIAANVSSRDLAAGVTSIGGSAVPNLITRNFQTTVELREGQTLAVAGLIQNNLGADSKRVPFFGDLPVVGRAFSFDRLTAGEQELVVLITPMLVHPLDPKEVPPVPGSDLFEPTDIEFYMLGRLESHRPYDYRSPIRTDWQRLMDYRRMENTYISGPHGYGD
jgi:pilus assembly protein CpaC